MIEKMNRENVRILPNGVTLRKRVKADDTDEVVVRIKVRHTPLTHEAVSALSPSQRAAIESMVKESAELTDDQAKDTTSIALKREWHILSYHFETEIGDDTGGFKDVFEASAEIATNPTIKIVGGAAALTYSIDVRVPLDDLPAIGSLMDRDDVVVSTTGLQAVIPFGVDDDEGEDGATEGTGAQLTVVQ